MSGEVTQPSGFCCGSSDIWVKLLGLIMSNFMRDSLLAGSQCFLRCFDLHVHCSRTLVVLLWNIFSPLFLPAFFPGVLCGLRWSLLENGVFHLTTHVSSINISWFYTLPGFLFSRSFPFVLIHSHPRFIRRGRSLRMVELLRFPLVTLVWKFVALLVGCLLLSRALVPGLCSLNTRKRHRFSPKAQLRPDWYVIQT